MTHRECRIVPVDLASSLEPYRSGSRGRYDLPGVRSEPQRRFCLAAHSATPLSWNSGVLTMRRRGYVSTTRGQPVALMARWNRSLERFYSAYLALPRQTPRIAFWETPMRLRFDVSISGRTITRSSIFSPSGKLENR